MKIKISRSFLTVLLSFCISFVYAQSISNYKAVYGSYQKADQSFIVLRTFENNKISYCLAVHTETLSTLLVPSAELTIVPASLEELRKQFSNTAYIRAIVDAENNSKQLQDAGVTHSIPKERGTTLTIDLCPSHKPLDRVVFVDLINEFKKIEMPVPMAVSVSGLWIEKHTDDLNWLKTLVNKGDLTIDWINHTYSHPTNKSLPLDQNFLLEHGVNVPNEILKNEIEMIQHGIVPSVFFRFPGLVSDQSIFLQVTAFGIIPVGSDAWLAKGQKPVDGSFILIHGNGNEPLGVSRFIQLLKSENSNIKNKQWKLYDIRGSLIQ